MKICLVGGIYDKDISYRAKHQITPETILEYQLRQRGHEVTVWGHNSFLLASAKDCDVVHVHHLARAAMLLARSRTRPPFVFTSHDGRALCGYGNSFMRRRLLRYIGKRADVTIAFSDFESKFLAQHLTPAPTKIVTIPNGIPSELSENKMNGTKREDEPFSILFVGQLIPLKGVDVLLRAVAMLEMDVRVLLVYQTDHLETELRVLAAKLNIQDRVKFLGIKSPEELAKIRSQSDVFVLPSYAEALPSVITEAMLSGIPVVASDIGCILDQLGGYGLTFPPGKAGILAQKLTYVYKNREHFSAVSEEMKTYAKQRFSVEVMVNKHLEAYEIAIQQNKFGAHPSSLEDFWIPYAVGMKSAIGRLRRMRQQ